jgi:flagellar basal body-associated protein FliL
MNAAHRELLFILLLMGFLLIICAAAVYIFLRQWRRERRGPEEKHSRSRPKRKA